jgi:CRISPR-associated protein Cas2
VRRRYLIAYDVSDDKRLQRIRTHLRGYGNSWQYSIFFCSLKPNVAVRLQSELEDIIDPAQDRVMFLKLGKSSHDFFKNLIWLGRDKPVVEEGFVVL